MLKEHCYRKYRGEKDMKKRNEGKNMIKKEKIVITIALVVSCITVDGNFRWQYKDFVACL